MKQTNTFTKIYDWMLDLELSKSELWVYARLHSLSADGKNTITVGNSWISEKLKISTVQVSRIVNSLEKKGLIEIDIRKHSGGTSRSITIVFEESEEPIEELIEEPKVKKEILEPPKAKQVKKSYGEFGNVKLTEEEAQSVLNDYGILFNEAIEILDDAIESKGYKYKSHRAVLKKSGWIWKKLHETNKKEIKTHTKWQDF